MSEPKIRFTFPDGRSLDVDIVEVLRRRDSQLSRLVVAEAERAQAIIASRAKTTKEDTNERYKKLDEKILACRERGEETRGYVKAWAAENDPPVSTDTVYRRIRLLKPK